MSKSRREKMEAKRKAAKRKRQPRKRNARFVGRINEALRKQSGRMRRSTIFAFVVAIITAALILSGKVLNRCEAYNPDLPQTNGKGQDFGGKGAQ